VTSLQTESGRKEQIHCRRRLDGKTKAVKGLAGQKELVIRCNPRHFGDTPKRRGAIPSSKTTTREGTHLKNMRIGLLEVARRFLWFL